MIYTQRNNIFICVHNLNLPYEIGTLENIVFMRSVHATESEQASVTASALLMIAHKICIHGQIQYINLSVYYSYLKLCFFFV